MAGLMARTSLDAGSGNVFIRLLPGEVRLTSRAVDGGTTVSNAAVGVGGANRWVRLRRAGGTLTAWTGTSGVSWTEVGSVAVDLGSDVLLGLATSARSETGTVTARYRELTDLRSAAGLAPPPTGLAGLYDDGIVDLTWTDAGGGRSGFRVQRRATGGLWQTLGFIGEGATHYMDTSAETGRIYQYRVAGETSAGVGAFGPPISVAT